MKLKDIINEDKNSEIKKLKDEYSVLKKKNFVSKQDLNRMQEIYRTLFIDYGYTIPSDETEWNKSKVANPKFKKSHRVTPFNKNRS